jgi:hypothetical protein
VPAEYDASLIARPKNPSKDFGWVYQGLTRRDPTLQVYQGRDDREASVLVKTTKATVGANDTLTIAIGTPDGSHESKDFSTDPAGQYTYPSWFGGVSTQGTAHALFWTNSPTTTLPTAYKAYVASPIALTSVEGAASFDLTTTAIVKDNVTGTVTPVADGDRSNSVFLRFNSGATITLAEHTPTMNAFSYVVPTLPNSSVTVAASEGYYSGPNGIAHQDGLSPGATSVALKIPAAAEPLAPVGGTADKVDNNTTFSFKGGPGSAGTFLISMENDDFYQTLYIVTTKKQFKIPEVAGGIFELDPMQAFHWRIETHGSFTTVDAMCGPTGFMDPFSYDWSTPQGPNQNEGTFTLSGGMPFTTAP